MIKRILLIVSLSLIMASGYAQDGQSYISSSESKAKYFPKNPLEVKTESKKDFTRWRFGMDIGASKYLETYHEALYSDEFGYTQGEEASFPLITHLQFSGLYYFSKHFGVGVKWDHYSGANLKGDFDLYPDNYFSTTLSYRYITPNKKHTIYTTAAGGYGYGRVILDVELGYDYHINDIISIGGKVSQSTIGNKPLSVSGGVGFHF